MSQIQALSQVNTNSKNGRGKMPAGPATDKLQPHNIEAEEATLGSLLISPDHLVFIKEFLRPDDFFRHHNGWIYEAICDLSDRRKPSDFVTLTDELRRRGRLDEAGGSAYLTGLINATPTSVNLQYYAEIVKRTATARRLIEGAGKMTRLAYKDNIPSSDMLQESSDILLDISKSNVSEGAKPASHFCDQILDDVEQLGDKKTATGLLTGLTCLDRLTAGLQKGTLTLVAGRPGMGKSSLVIQILSYIAKEIKRRSQLFSQEMPGKQITRRMISAESGVDSRVLRDGPIGEQMGAVIRATYRVSEWPVSIDDRARTIEEIRSRSIVYQARYGLDLLAVDYIQRVGCGGSYKNRDSEIGRVSSELKNLALDLRVPVIAVASLSRACEGRQDKRPVLSDLRESGNLEYDADLVIFLYRDDHYNPNTNYPNITEINLAKHRDGPTGVFSVYWKKETTTMGNLETRREKI